VVNEVNIDDIQLGHLLGQGAYGKAVATRSRPTSTASCFVSPTGITSIKCVSSNDLQSNGMKFTGAERVLKTDNSAE
jgi:hypothetical protein